jgi:predicted Zn-dependent peptidase
MTEVRKLREELVSAVELQRHKDQLKAGLMLNLDSTSSRMSSLAQQEITFGDFIAPDEIIAQVNLVTAEDVQRLAAEIFQTDSLAVTLLGNLRSFRPGRAQLQC